MKISLPDPCLVVLVGAAGSGKSTFARAHFRPTEVLSSDFFRAMVSDDEADQSASRDAFDLLHLAAARRLARRRLTVIDATSLRPEVRRPLLELAQRHHLDAVAVVFNLAPEVCLGYDQQRSQRRVGAHVIHSHTELLRRALGQLEHEGFRTVYQLSSAEEVAAVSVERQPLPLDRRSEHGPFDLIGDVHGCPDELAALLGRLGYRVEEKPEADGGGFVVQPPPGRKAVFVGDLVDRGPNSPAVLRLVMGMVKAGTALCVVGNHDDKLLRKLRGNAVQMTHGLAETLAQLEAESETFKEEVRLFLEGLPSHYLLDDGKLVVAHAGLLEYLHGRDSGRVRSFALYGQTTGKKDENGLPIRGIWATDYPGRALLVYGHTPVQHAAWLNRTINIDTGCVFGGRLSALRYPEGELVSVPAARVYCEPGRPFEDAAPAPLQETPETAG
jgi:protein phosphatase